MRRRATLTRTHPAIAAQIARTGALLLVLFAGCDFFSPREPEPPVNRRTVCYENQESSAKVLYDLKCALEGASAGSNNYQKLISPTFLFFPDQGEDRLLPASWNDSSDVYYTQTILSDAESVAVLSLRQANIIDSTTDSVVVNLEYSFEYKSFSQNFLVPIAGMAEVKFQPDSTKVKWYIERWKDFKTTQASTWGYFKYRGVSSGPPADRAEVRRRNVGVIPPK
jgi:hypothetical protein